MAASASLSLWMRNFRAQHEKARTGKLTAQELDAYRTARDELARALLVVQRLTVKPGETPRQSLRVARALQVDLDLITSKARAITIDISTGGFACLLAKAPAAGDECGYSLRIPGSEQLAGKVRAADIKPMQGNVRVSFQFVGLTAEERERLEMFVYDAVLSLMAT
jgi:hypothetical protein